MKAHDRHDDDIEPAAPDVAAQLVELMDLIRTTAHDFNNLLTTVVLDGERVGAAGLTDTERQLRADRIVTAGLRGRELADRLAQLTGENQPETPTSQPLLPKASSRTPKLLNVLIVEDDELVRDTIVNMVSSVGYAAVGVDCGDRAIDIISAAPIFDVVVTDLGMPGMTGEEVADWIEQNHPGIAVMILTGQSRPSLRPGSTRTVLRKPIRLADLQHAIETAQAS